MEDKWMVVHKDTITSRIRRFFQKLFSKKEKYIAINTKTTENKENATINDAREKFLDVIKVEREKTDENTYNSYFLKKINGNIEELNMLSLDQLKKLEKYYSSIIEENDKKIKRLKANI